MGVVTVGTEIIRPLARSPKVSRSFSMDPRLPVFENVAVAFSAKSIAFGEIDQLPIVKTQLISILRIMAIETPSHRFGVMELDIGVLFF